MSQILEKIRLRWWKRGYKKIWGNSILKERTTFSAETKDDADRLFFFLRDRIDRRGAKIILDVGCGNGVLAERVFSECDLLIHTDYSFGATKLIKTNNSSVRQYVFQSDAGNLPLKEGMFDYIFAYSLLHYSGSTDNAKKWIKNMLTLLKNGGRLYLGDVPLAKKLWKKLKSNVKNIKTLNHIKYYFAEFMQNSFSLDDFTEIEGASEIRVISQPEYFKFSAWRVDIEIRKYEYK